MAGTVAGYPIGTFTTPVEGGSLDASVVTGNDNAVGAKHNSHDADATIHVQSSALASRPGAGTAQRFWVTTDGLRAYLDSGSVWGELAYLPLVGGTVTGATTFSAAITYGGVTLSNAVTGTGNMVLSASPTLTGTITAAAANFSGAVDVAGNFSVATSKFTVAAASGNTVIAGSCVVTGTSNTTGASRIAFDFSGSTGGVGFYGANGSTNGILNFNSYRSDGSNGVQVLQLTSTAAAFSGAIAVSGITTLAIGGAFSGATTIAASGLITSTKTGQFLFNNTATTGNVYVQLTNTSGQVYLGIESSAGGSIVTGSTGYDTILTGQTGLSLSGDNGTSVALRLTGSTAVFGTSIKTAAPNGGTAAAWKLGTVSVTSPTSPNRTIELDVAGTIYYLAAKTTNN